MNLQPLPSDARSVRLLGGLVPVLVVVVVLVVVGLSGGLPRAAGQSPPDASPATGGVAKAAATVGTSRWAERIVLASGETFAGAWVGALDGEAWQFRLASPRSGGDGPQSGSLPASADALRRVPTEDLVRYGAAVAPASGSGIWLVDGSFLVGRIAALNVDGCRLVSGTFDVTIPWARVRSLLLHAPATDRILHDQLRAAVEATGADDQVLLVDGERRAGTLQLTEASLYPGRQHAAVRLKGASEQTTKIPFREIRSMIPSPLLRDPVSQEKSGQRQPAGNAAGRVWVGLRDGSRLNVPAATFLIMPSVARLEETGPQATGQGGAATGHSVTLACGVELTGRSGRPVPDWPAQVVSLAPAQPPVPCLPQQPPLRYQHQPFFGAAVPLLRWQADDTVAALTGPAVAGRRYPNGVLMHTAARAVYPVGEAKRLVGAVAAIADPMWQAIPARQLAENLGLRFRVQTVDAQGTVRDRWDSGVVRPGQSARPFDLDIAGAAFVILAVDSATAGDFGDRAVWLDLLATSATSDQDGR